MQVPPSVVILSPLKEKMLMKACRSLSNILIIGLMIFN